MFTNNQRQEERTGKYGTPRVQYLQVCIVHESFGFWQVTCVCDYNCGWGFFRLLKMSLKHATLLVPYM